MTDPCWVAEFYQRLLAKLHEDLVEAYLRTPPTVSSKPYVERALRLARAGLSVAERELRKCSKRAEAG